MAQKQKKRKSKRGMLRTALFYILFPLMVWFAAFLLWFYWHDLTRLFGHSERSAKPSVKSERRNDQVERSGSTPASQPKEKLSDEDRKKLDEILKRRQK
jgi:hypothetical protein